MKRVPRQRPSRVLGGIAMVVWGAAVAAVGLGLGAKPILINTHLVGTPISVAVPDEANCRDMPMACLSVPPDRWTTSRGISSSTCYGLVRPPPGDPEAKARIVTWSGSCRDGIYYAWPGDDTHLYERHLGPKQVLGMLAVALIVFMGFGWVSGGVVRLRRAIRQRRWPTGHPIGDIGTQTRRPHLSDPNPAEPHHDSTKSD